MTNVDSVFNNVKTTYASDMNDSGQATVYWIALGTHYGWLYSGGTTATHFSVLYNGVNSALSTYSLGINSSGDIGGNYLASTGATQQAFVYLGGTSYTLSSPGNAGPAGVTALNANGQAVGWLTAGGGGPGSSHNAVVWSYTISNGTMTQNGTNLESGLAADFGAESSQSLAINSSGMVLVGACNSALLAAPNLDTAYYLYNMTSQAYTSLGSLMLYDPISTTTSTGGGHDQALNNVGQVVGYIGTQGTTWHAAVWQNGVITDLNTEYAGILPAGFTLNYASAIDNNGDIAGYGTDTSNNTYQAFEIMTVPEPGTLTLLLAGLVGLLACAWRKRN